MKNSTMISGTKVVAEELSKRLKRTSTTSYIVTQDWVLRDGITAKEFGDIVAKQLRQEYAPMAEVAVTMTRTLGNDYQCDCIVTPKQ